MKPTNLTFFVCILFFQLVTSTSFAQSTCDASSIDTAENRYAIGKLTECIDGLQYCLQHKGFSTGQQVRAYKLIAMSYLAMDMRNSADSAIQNIFYLQPDFAADITDPDRFKNELLFLRFNQSGTVVSSVSKRPEDIRLAPATTAVITQKEILQRGYTDLIDILKDIPGFDISVYYGQLYANVYQRGLRTNNTDKTLLLFDGVEDNDLWSNFPDISQQYPVTNIKRVEIIYGPASTMYGPNAFSGVINVITKEEKDYLHNNRAFGLQFNAGTGSYNTRYLDLSAAYKKGIVSFSISGRVYYSDRPDLSSEPIYNFEKSEVDSLVIAKSSRYTYKINLGMSSGAKEYLDANGIKYSSSRDNTVLYVKSLTNTKANLFKLHYDPAKGYDSLILLDSGIARARKLDTSFDVPAQNKLFKNPARAYYMDAKVAVGDINIGVMLWKKQEGIGTTYSDRVAGINGSVWQPIHNNIYLNFNRHLSSRTDFSVLANYRIHKIDNDSRIVQIRRYLTGDLNPVDLYLNRLPYLDTAHYYEASEQFRSELKLIYSPSQWFNLVSGVEVRSSLLQGYLLSDTATSLPEENGITFDSSGRNNTYNVNDFGIYTQGTFRTKGGFGITLGGRVNYNRIRHNGGTGWTFSPRVVADYSLGKKVLLKAIYSTGILNPSNFSKFDTYRTSPNPELNTEYISNYELSADYQASKHLSANVDAYYSKERNVVGVISIPQDIQNQNIGRFEIFGTQANLSFITKNFQATLNYSYTFPNQTQGSVPDTIVVYDTSNLPKVDTITTIQQVVGDVTYRVADIASHKANLILNYVLLKHINLNLRLNYVGEKRAGEGTTAYLNLINRFSPYLVANASVTVFDVWKTKGVSLQVNCNNIFDKMYYSPGIRGARGLNAPNEILQMGRNFSIKLNYEF